MNIPNPIRKFAEKKIDLQNLSSKLQQVAQKGVELTSFTKELIEKEIELTRNEVKYRNLSNLFQTLVDNTPDMIWAKDLEGRYIFTNKAIRERFLGIETYDEALGKTDEELGNSNPIAAKVMETGRPMMFLKNGGNGDESLIIHVCKAPLFGKHGEVVGTVSVGRDVTDLIAAQQELLECYETESWDNFKELFEEYIGSRFWLYQNNKVS